MDTTAGKLINTEKVFKYTSASGSTNDWWLYSQAIPQGYQNRNMVLQLQYYMVETSGDNLNEAFRFVARDATNGKVTQLNGAVSSSNTITLDAFADGDFTVGDRVTFKDTGGAIHFRFITSVTHGSEQLTISGAAVSIADDSYFVSGILTDELDYLPKFKPTTAGQDGSKAYRKQLVIPSNCDTLEFGFHYLGSETDQFLYYDDIALSANQFLQVSSQPQSSKVMYHNSAGYGSDSNNKIFKFVNEISNDIPASAATIDNNSASGFSLTANAKIKVDATLSFNMSSGGTYAGWSLNASSLTTTLPSLTQSEQVGMAQSMASNGYNSVTASIIMEKGDILRPHGENSSIAEAARQTMQIVVTPEVNDVVLLNSQDEIFTDWESYTPTITGQGTVSDMNARWRRVGSDIEIDVWYIMGSLSGATPTMSLPSGITPDQGKLPPTQKAVVGEWWWADDGFVVEDNARSGIMIFYGSNWDRVAFIQKGDGATGWEHQDANAIWGQGDDGIALKVKFPVAGWTSTFNPVLSMPLVDLGSDKGEGLWHTAVAYGTTNGTVLRYSTETYNTLSGLGTVVYNSAAYGWSFTATQNVRVTAVQTISSSAGGAYFGWSLNASDATSSIESLTYANGKLLVKGNQSANCLDTIPVTVLMKAGDVLRPQGAGSTVDNLLPYQSIHLVAEKDYSHTNMAHIIKPAVMTFAREVANGTYGGTVTSGSWIPVEINIFGGETWFATKGTGTLGVGGTNVSINLEPGTYEIQAQVNPYAIDSNILKLYDQTNSKDVARSINSYANQAYNGAQSTTINHTWTVTSTTEYRLFLRCSNTKADYGFGVNFSLSGYTEKYLTGYIRKLK